MSLIAVTGGIGAGKTAVLRFFRKFGAAVLDADDVAHAMCRPGTGVHRELLSRWGEDVLGADGRVDRRAVAERVFADPRELAWLDSVMHPAIRQAISREASRRREDLYCAIPLLYESGWQEDVRSVVVLWCDEETQKRRLLARGWSEEQIASRLAAQLSMDEKLLLGDYGIISNCSWEILEQQCAVVHRRIQARIRGV